MPYEFSTMLLGTLKSDENMLKNYFTVAFRNMKRHKGYSFINIAGLSLGIACCVFILLFVRLELSYDSYHPDVDRIFRVGLMKETEKGKKAEGSNLIPMGLALLDIAKKSTFENANILIILHRRGYITEERRSRLLERLDHLCRNIINFKNTLK